MLPVLTSITTPALTESARNDEWTRSLAALLERARCELGRDRAAAGATLAMASALLRVELDRKSSGNGPTSIGLAGWQSQRVRAYIDDHLDETIHVKDLSAIARRSSAHFSRAFKRTFGESPHAYIVRRRLDRATYLMLSTDAPLSEIALSCGFTDQAHLSNLFRRHVGASPATWRRERREMNRRTIGSIGGAAHAEAVATQKSTMPKAGSCAWMNKSGHEASIPFSDRGSDCKQLCVNDA